jgi:hypothetical protein
MISEVSPELAVLWNNLIGVQRPQPLIGIVTLQLVKEPIVRPHSLQTSRV